MPFFNIYLFVFIYLTVPNKLVAACSSFFFFFFFFYLCRILAVARCSAQASLLFSMWDLSSLTRDQTQVPCFGRQILNHCTTREVPMQILNCSIWDLVPRPGIEPRSPALGTWSLSHWITKEVPDHPLWLLKAQVMETPCSCLPSCPPWAKHLTSLSLSFPIA